MPSTKRVDELVKQNDQLSYRVLCYNIQDVIIESKAGGLWLSLHLTIASHFIFYKSGHQMQLSAFSLQFLYTYRHNFLVTKTESEVRFHYPIYTRHFVEGITAVAVCLKTKTVISTFWLYFQNDTPSYVYQSLLEYWILGKSVQVL